MVGSILRFAAAAAFCILVAGCAGAPQTTAYDGGGVLTQPGAPLQCVPYARAHSQIALYGDAYTWWDQADGRYARAPAPSEGAVLVLNGYAGPQRAHLAVVRRVVSAREIRIDHANWLDDGAVYLDDPVIDVSPANDWSQVRVYNVRDGIWGTRTYPVQGFIGPGAPGEVQYAQNALPKAQQDDARYAQNPPAKAAPNDPIGQLITSDSGLIDDNSD